MGFIMLMVLAAVQYLHIELHYPTMHHAMSCVVFTHFFTDYQTICSLSLTLY